MIRNSFTLPKFLTYGVRNCVWAYALYSHDFKLYRVLTFLGKVLSDFCYHDFLDFLKRTIVVPKQNNTHLTTSNLIFSFNSFMNCSAFFLSSKMIKSSLLSVLQVQKLTLYSVIISHLNFFQILFIPHQSTGLRFVPPRKINFLRSFEISCVLPTL